MPELPWYIPVLIFIARIGDVSIGTVKTMLIVGGARVAASALGFVEVIIWALAITGLIQYLGHPVALISYAGGFATGTFIGMIIESKLAYGFRTVQVIHSDQGLDLSSALRQKEYRVTRLEGEGKMGPVEIVLLTVRRRELPAALAMVESLAPRAFVTVQRADRATGSNFHRLASETIEPPSRRGQVRNRVGGGLAAPVLPHHRTYSAYPAVSFNVVARHTSR